ncbi:MAG: restriction endonuclease subunit S [Kouleothrix sp.]|nr:restriction endonuclease subunit S [Kouleothrix sp.]
MPDDIVLVREGGGTGKAAIVEDGHRFSLGQRVMMLRPDQSQVVPRFFLYQILSPTIYDDHILALTKGSASPHLNISVLRKFPFVLPPMKEQSRIASHLDSLQAKVDVLKALQAATQAELDALLPAVLDRAFKGEL